MKNIVKTVIVISVLICSLSLEACAQDSEYKQIYNELDSATAELMESAGVSEVSFDDVFNITPRKVVDILVGAFKGNMKEPIKSGGISLTLLVMSAVLHSFDTGSKLTNDNAFTFAESSIIIVSLVIPLSETIACAASSIELMSGFMLTYIPVFTGIVSASGQALTGFAYSGSMLVFANICEKVLTGIFIPVVSIITVINVFSSLNNNIDVTSITKIIKKVITVSLTVVSGIFVGLVSLKGNLAASSDSLAVKGVKLLSGSVIPIVGGALGDAFSSVLGTFSLIKSVVGVFGIIAVLLISLPVVIKLLMWYFTLSFCALAASATGSKQLNKVFESLSSCVSIINIITLFSSTVFIISTGLILNLRG